MLSPKAPRQRYHGLQEAIVKLEKNLTNEQCAQYYSIRAGSAKKLDFTEHLGIIILKRLVYESKILQRMELLKCFRSFPKQV